MTPSKEFEKELKRLSTLDATIMILQVTFVVLSVATVVVLNW